MKWTSVAIKFPEVYHDSLDESSDYVLGWCEVGDEKVKLVRYRHDLKKFVDVNNKEVHLVTHWCEVTEPEI